MSPTAPPTPDDEPAGNLQATESVEDSHPDQDEPPEILLFGLSFGFGLLLWLPGYFLSCTIHTLLRRRGIPVGPLAWMPFAGLVTAMTSLIEDDVRASPYWDRIENHWYTGVIGTAMIPPAVIEVFAPRTVANRLPIGTSMALSLAIKLSFIFPIVLLRRKVQRAQSHDAGESGAPEQDQPRG